MTGASENALLREIGRIHTYWVRLMANALTNPSANLTHTLHSEAFERVRTALVGAPLEPDVKKVLAEFSYGLLHSLLVAFDGGSQLADECQISLVDADGKELCKYLHELLPDYLEDIANDNS